MSDGFPLLTTKKMYFKGIVTELLWFLRGDTNIKYLVDNGCHIWDGDCFSNYCKKYWELDERSKIEYGSSCYIHEANEYNFETYPKEEFINKIKTDDDFAKKWGELGPIYGKQWRSWKQFVPYNVTENNCQVMTQVTDQIANLINDLKTNPDSRRLMVNAWNVGELDMMVLPPCHYGFQVYTRELSWEERVEIARKTLSKETFYEYGNLSPFTTPIITYWLNQYNIPTRAISLMFSMRSNDVPLGLPFNLASYGLLLELFGELVNMIPDELIANLGDAHIYLNQIDGVKEQLTREPFDLPTLRINTEFWPTKSGECGIGELTEDIDFLIREMRIDDFQIENYKSHPSIKLPLSN
jgi:thymidylate synthase